MSPLLKSLRRERAKRVMTRNRNEKKKIEWQKSVKQAAKKLSRKVASHVDSERGMSNKILQTLASSACEVLAPCRLAGHVVLKPVPHPLRGGRIKWDLVPGHGDGGRGHGGGGDGFAPDKPLKKSDIYFKGVYCSDELPYDLLRLKKDFSIIVNLATRKKKKSNLSLDYPLIPAGGGHFVSITTKGDNIYYSDPFGIACYHPLILDFINSFRTKSGPSAMKRKKSFFMRRRIQSAKSVHCGLYTLLFTMAREANIDVSIFDFTTKKLEDNDKKCENYINLMMENIC
jgi:hypothetical protein